MIIIDEDDLHKIGYCINNYAKNLNYDLILTTGGKAII